MNAVIGFTDLLLETNLDVTQLDFAKTIQSGAEGLLALLNDILDLSKIEARELDLEEIEFDPELFAYDICELIRPKTSTKPIEILCRIGDDLPSVLMGDPVRLKQVFMNLMGNAAKFTESGEIELTVNAEELDETRLKLFASVRDTGIGIPKEKLSSVFKPFRQADGSTTRRYGGTGLGLAICKQIAKLVGGEIWVESTLGQGSTFYFTALLRKAGETKGGRFSPVSLEGKRVLVVDDNLTNISILRNFLESAGMVVSMLDTGKAVVRALKRAAASGAPFDLCVCDIQMPEMDGYEVAQEIRKSEEAFSRIPLIALSSHMDDDAKKCEKAGFNSFLSKPICREKLFLMVEMLLAERTDEAAPDHQGPQHIMTQYSIREEMKRSVEILLAEDNPINQKLAEMLLTRAGYRVVTANNGKEAVRKFLASPERINLIFMDIQMPEMDGFEATQMLRDKGFSSIPIIAMTAHAMKGDREKCLDAGMDDYIPKPIKREVVFDMVEKWAFTRRDAQSKEPPADEGQAPASAIHKELEARPLNEPRK
jgi:CheY-like chemotaxis protein